MSLDAQSERLPSPDAHKADKIVLCLSGGGLRATYFHLGIIHALRFCKSGDQRLLEKVDEIYSVSGGSILSAHLIKNWDQYCGTDEDFATAVKEIKDFGTSDVRGRVVRRWLLSIITILPGLAGAGRGFWLQREYKRLLGVGALADCYHNAKKTPPNLHILTTSFNTGEQCSFTKEGFEIQTKDGPIRENGDLLSLPLAVTASSAFPPLFPPLKLTRKMLGSPKSDRFIKPVFLSDGGVFDNLGYSKYRAANFDQNTDPHVVLIANAGASLQGNHEDNFQNLVARNLRASEILMQRVADQTIDATETSAVSNIIHANIEHTVSNPDTATTTQERIPLIRTDLDRFTPTEIEVLIAHGYRVATNVFNCSSKEEDENTPNVRVDKNIQDRVVRKAEKRRLWPFNPRDIATYFLAPLILCLLLFFTTIIIAAWNTREAIKAEQVALSGKAEALERESKALQEKVLAQEEERQALADKAAASDQFRDRVAVLEKENAELRDKANVIPETAPGSLNQVSKARYRVWIQFAGFKRETMIRLGKSLNNTWPNVPGADRGGERTESAIRQNEVRFGPDEDRLAAQKLANDLNENGLLSKQVKINQLSIIPPNSLEIWVSK